MQNQLVSSEINFGLSGRLVRSLVSSNRSETSD